MRRLVEGVVEDEASDIRDQIHQVFDGFREQLSSQQARQRSLEAAHTEVAADQAFAIASLSHHVEQQLQVGHDAVAPLHVRLEQSADEQAAQRGREQSDQIASVLAMLASPSPPRAGPTESPTNANTTAAPADVAELVAPTPPTAHSRITYPFHPAADAIAALVEIVQADPPQMLIPNFVLEQDRDLREQDTLRIRAVGGKTLADSLRLTVPLFLGGVGPYTLEDFARDIELGFLVLSMEQAKNHKPRTCAHDGCRAFTYLNYFRADDEGNTKGSVYQPRAACGMKHVLPDGPRDSVFPLPLCCLDGCDNEIAAGDSPDHGGPKAACTTAHFILHNGSASKQPRRATKRAGASAPSATLPRVPSAAAPTDPLLGRRSSLLSPVAHSTKSRPSSVSFEEPIDTARFFLR